MSKKKICSNCSSANQENATVCAVCRVPLDSEDLDDSTFNEVLDKEIQIHRAEYTGPIHPGACTECDLIFRPGASNCKKCGTPLTPIKLSSHVIEEIPIEGKSFKEISSKNSITFWLSRLSIFILIFGLISVVVWLTT